MATLTQDESSDGKGGDEELGDFGVLKGILLENIIVR
jgi:hypothetical protein